MSGQVKVKTDGDGFASIEYGMALVEFQKDGDSPNCPRSWTWGLWYDGNLLDATCDETSLSKSVRDATIAIGEVIRELGEVRDYIAAYGVFCWGPDTEEDE